MAAKCVTDMTACEMQRNTICLAVNAASNKRDALLHVRQRQRLRQPDEHGWMREGELVGGDAGRDPRHERHLRLRFPGHGGLGRLACTTKYDCKNKNQICDTKNGTALCSDKVTKSKGQPRGNHGEICSSEFAPFDGSTGSYTCTAKAIQGAPCSAAIPCVDPYRCDSASGPA